MNALVSANSPSILVGNTNLDFRPVRLGHSAPTGGQILAANGTLPQEEYVILQWLPEGNLDEVRYDEIVNIDTAIPCRFIVAKRDRLFHFVIDERSIRWPQKTLAVVSIKTLGQVGPGAQVYQLQENLPDLLLSDDAVLDLSKTGTAQFYSKTGIWRLNVQGVQITSDAPTIVVRDALIKAQFDPTQGWIIVLKSAGGKRQVDLTDVIDLREPGIEKLRLTPREINNG